MGKCYTTVVLSVLVLIFPAVGYAQEIDLSTLLEHHQAPVFLQSPGQTYVLGIAGDQRDVKPPLSAIRIAGESLLGGAGNNDNSKYDDDHLGPHLYPPALQLDYSIIPSKTSSSGRKLAGVDVKPKGV